MRPKYEDVLAAVREYEASLWATGDAALEELGQPKGTRADFARAREVTPGRHETERLVAQWRLAAAFPSETRRRASWALHQYAGSPDVLDVMLQVIESEPEKYRGPGSSKHLDYLRQVIRKHFRSDRPQQGGSHHHV
jgi:hypothetical protein